MGDFFLGQFLSPATIVLLLESNNVMSKSYSYHNSRSRDNDDYHYRSRHEPYSPNDRERHHYPRNRGSSYRGHDSRPHDHDRHSNRRYRDLRSSDPYRHGKHTPYHRDHESEYSCLRRTEPPDYVPNRDTRSYPQRPPHRPSSNSVRYPPPHYSNPPTQYHTHPQREPMVHFPPPQNGHTYPPQPIRAIDTRDPKFMHQQIPAPTVQRHTNTYIPSAPPTIFPPQSSEELPDPPHIKNFRDWVSNKLQFRIKYTEGSLKFSQVVNDYEKSLEECRALEKKLNLAHTRGRIIQEELTKLE